MTRGTGETADDDLRARADDERAVAALLRTFVRGTLPLTVVWGLVSWWTAAAFPTRTLLEASVFCGLGLTALRSIATGRVKFAVRLMCTVFWCVVAWSSYTSNGVQAAAFPAFAALILMTGVLWSSRAAFVMTGLSAALGAALLALGARGLLPAAQLAATSTGRWLACCLIFGTVATLQLLSARTARESLARARAENSQRRRVEQQRLETLGALEQSEKRYRHIFESAAVALFEVDLSGLVTLRDELLAKMPGTSLATRLAAEPGLLGALAHRVRILDANDAALHLVELTDKQPLLSPLDARFAPDNRKDVVGFAIGLLETHDSVQQELSVVTFRGRPRRVLVTGRAPQSAGAFERLVLSVVDVTEQRQLEARSRAAQRLEAIGRLAGGVAHDFNNALVVIMSWATLLRRPGQSAAERDSGLEAIHKSAARAAELTHQLLSIGRRGVHTAQPTNIVRIVDDTVQAISRLVPADVELKAEHACDRLAMVNEGQLQQVLLNLALNARDAMPQGGKLQLRTRVADPAELSDLPHDTQFVAITVSDTGIGMDAATQERIFEPFFTTKAEGRGTGLGLATAHAIVVESRGKISVESAVDRGTSFHVYLPVAQAQSARIVATPSAPVLLGHGRTVLLVEDEPLVRDVLVTALRSAGYEVLDAPDGARALELARARQQSSSPIDLLCTDGILPGMATRALIEGFLTFFPSAPVLVCSGHVEEELVRRRIEHGEWSFLAKPFLPSELLGRLGELLGRAQQ